MVKYTNIPYKGGEMQKIFQRIAIVCILMLTMLFAGCSALNANVDELLRAPLLEGGYTDLQTTITNTFGKNAHLEYPSKGELLSPFLFGDWNGDNIEDAAVFFTLPDIPNVQLAVLYKDNEDNWKISDVSALLSDTIEQLQTISIQNNSKNEILITYDFQNQKYMSVFSINDNLELNKILESQYTQFLLEDFTHDNCDDLVIVLEQTLATTQAPNSSETTSGTIQENTVPTTSSPTVQTATNLQLLLLTYNENDFIHTQITGLNAEQFTGYAQISVSRHSSGVAHLVIDGWTSNANDHLASSIISFNEETVQFENAILLGTSDLYADSQRYIRTLLSQDIDGDGIIEIPTQTNNEETSTYLNYVQHKQISFVRWMDFTKPYSQKSFGIYDDEFGFYMELPWELEGEVLLTDGEISGTIEIRDLTGETLYASLSVGDTAHSLAWQKIGTASSQNIYIKLGEDVIGDPLYDFLTIERFKNGIHLFDENSQN